MAGEYTRKRSYELLRSQLEIERSSFSSTWRDCAELILPRRARFFVSDSNKGDRRTRSIVDSTATFAAGTLRSGMMAGVTSPARPWFKLTTPDPDLADSGAVKQWLSQVTQAMNAVFLKSNLYQVLPILYGDMGVFGTGCVFMEPDSEHVVRFTPFAIGSYMISNDERLKVCVFIRDYRMTVRQLLGQFGERNAKGEITNWENFSINVKNLYDQGALEQWIDVCHVVRPNEDHDPRKSAAKYKKFSSVYYERGNGGGGVVPFNGASETYDESKFLRESGYDFFPALAARWEVTGEDVYGTSCPGVTALGDIRALQTMQKRKAEAVEKMVRPPMQGPPSLMNQKASILPGDITYVSDPNGQGFRPSMVVNVDLQHLLLDVQDHQHRIDRSFYADLFLLMSNSDRRDITAREIDERHEEKLLALGPVLEQLNQDVLDPLIDNTFAIMIEQNLIPEAPQELHGTDLKVEYISIMAQAQKLVGTSGIERFAQFAGQVAQFKPEVLDKINVDELIDTYGDSLGVAAKILVPDDQVAAIRQQRAQQQAAAQQAAQMHAAAQTTKTLGDTPLDPNTALGGLMNQATAGQ